MAPARRRTAPPARSLRPQSAGPKVFRASNVHRWSTAALPLQVLRLIDLPSLVRLSTSCHGVQRPAIATQAHCARVRPCDNGVIPCPACTCIGQLQINTSMVSLFTCSCSGVRGFPTSYNSGATSVAIGIVVLLDRRACIVRSAPRRCMQAAARRMHFSLAARGCHRQHLRHRPFWGPADTTKGISA